MNTLNEYHMKVASHRKELKHFAIQQIVEHITPCDSTSCICFDLSFVLLPKCQCNPLLNAFPILHVLPTTCLGLLRSTDIFFAHFSTLSEHPVGHFNNSIILLHIADAAPQFCLLIAFKEFPYFPLITLASFKIDWAHL